MPAGVVLEYFECPFELRRKREELSGISVLEKGQGILQRRTLRN